MRELGTDPSPQVVALHERILRAGTPAEAPATAGPPAARPTAGGGAPGRSGRRVHGLRSYATTLVGRTDDVAAVEAALSGSRLVTVLGPGGLGKTRLAQEVASRAAQGGSQVAVVELVGVRADEDVLLALADALDVAPGARSVRLSDRLQAGDLAGQVAASLRDSDALVVLDNCEHVVEGAARWAGTLLEASPRLRVLATSRTPLLLGQEHLYEPTPLGSDPSRDDGGPAVRLFVERARAVRPDALLDRASVARLCDRLDGLPLAIELAAARVRTLSVAEVDARLDERFALLRVRDRSVPDRHRTLEAVLDWSWNLLSAGQQALWRRTALLPDGFSAEAARALRPEAPGWQVDDDVDALVLQSLVRVEETDGVARYRMVETVREFGLLRLAAAHEERVAGDAVLGWAQAVARRCASRLLSPEQRVAVAELGREQENLVFAVRRAADVGRPDVVVRGFVALLGSWAVRGAEERIVGLVSVVLDSLVGWDVPEEHADTTALALEVTAASAVFGVPGSAARPLARLRRLLRSSGAVGSRTRELAGLVLARTPEEGTAQLARLQASPDAYTSLLGHMFEAQQRENDGQLERALELAVAAHGLAVGLGDTAATAMTGMVVASFLAERGEAPEAVRWVRAARGDLAAVGVDVLNPQVEWVELSAALTLGDVETAEAVVATMTVVFDEQQGSRAAEAAGLVELGRGELAWLRGDREAALVHLGRAVRTFGPGQPQGDAAPWFLLTASAVLVRRVQAGAGDEGLVRRVVEVGRRLRSAGRGYVDRPVLATSAVGVAAWACLGAGLGQGPDARRVRDVVELLALVERLGGRQDLPALHRAPLRDAVAASGPDAGAALAAADRRVAALRDDELVPRTDELLARLGQEADQEPPEPRGPGGAAQAFFM